MPISGYEIETEHAPIDSTALDQSGNVFQLISPGIATKFMFHVSIYTERAMYRSVCIDFSAVASFPSS